MHDSQDTESPAHHSVPKASPRVSQCVGDEGLCSPALPDPPGMSTLWGRQPLPLTQTGWLSQLIDGTLHPFTSGPQSPSEEGKHFFWRVKLFLAFIPVLDFLLLSQNVKEILKF